MLALVLFFSHVSSHGSDCGTILSPKVQLPTDPNPLLAGCGGSRLARTLLVVVSQVSGHLCTLGCLALNLIHRDDLPTLAATHARAGPEAA